MTEPLSDKLNNQQVSRETGCGTDAQTTENNNAQSRNRFAPVFQIYLLTQFVIYYKKQLLRYLSVPAAFPLSATTKTTTFVNPIIPIFPHPLLPPLLLPIRNGRGKASKDISETSKEVSLAFPPPTVLIPHSCTECMRRKTRCSKVIPCEPCSKRGVAHLCRQEQQFGPPIPIPKYVHYTSLANPFADNFFSLQCRD